MPIFSFFYVYAHELAWTILISYGHQIYMLLGSCFRYPRIYVLVVIVNSFIRRKKHSKTRFPFALCYNFVIKRTVIISLLGEFINRFAELYRNS